MKAVNLSLFRTTRLLVCSKVVWLCLIFSFIREPSHAAEPIESSVIVYASQDQIYAEPILNAFQRETHIRVKAVYDSEAVKTVGLANRLLAERKNPQCDLFWSNEELRTRQLTKLTVLESDPTWTAIGYRSRRIAYNTNFLSEQSAPRSLTELTNAVWRGKVALAYPLFGTTATHFLALRQHWGKERWKRWCLALAANQPFIVDGNSVAAKLAARGEAWIALTDSDDIFAEQSAGAPLTMCPQTDETLLIPNAVGLVRGRPHPGAAKRLAEYLKQPKIAVQLIKFNALEGDSAASQLTPTLHPDWDALLHELDEGVNEMKQIFLR